MKRFAVAAQVPVFLALFLLSSASAMKLEMKGGNLSGRIYESGTGAGIAGLTVKLTAPKSVAQPEKVTTTDGNGGFRFPKVKEGKYLIEVYQGVTLLYRDVVEVKANMRKDISLQKKQ